MTRREDWPLRLHRFIAQRRDWPFEWGRTDCALFASDWIWEATGVDPAEAFRGKYTTAAGAARALKRYGAGDLEGTATMMLGGPIPRLKARRGDIVSVETGGQVALGVCLGGEVACVSPEGMVTIPLRQARRAWRV